MGQAQRRVYIAIGFYVPAAQLLESKGDLSNLFILGNVSEEGQWPAHQFGEVTESSSMNHPCFVKNKACYA